MTCDTSELSCDSLVDIFYNIEVCWKEYIKESLMDLEEWFSRLFIREGMESDLQMVWKLVHSSGDIEFVPQAHCSPVPHQEAY